VTSDQAVLLALGGLAAVCAVLAVAVVRFRAAAAHLRSDLSVLQQRLDEVERGRQGATPAGAATVSAPAEFVITDLGREDAVSDPARPDAPAFADIVVKEAVVRAASLAHGVRRGLAPATRNRIRFEMKQEVRRSRKQRRADLKAAQRDLHARQRAALAEEAS
jgi:hypothetical protein